MSASDAPDEAGPDAGEPSPAPHRCPLCEQAEGPPFYQDERDYLRCGVCQLVFVPSRFFLSAERERAVYDRHENTPDDEGYRRFLSRMADPLCERLSPGSRGLDFGCGPGPTLSVMLAEAGHHVAIYDPFYAPDASLMDENHAAHYDFITATEVVEHLHRPGRELERLWGCLKPGGLLGIMTKRVRAREAFARWHYKNDPTHVCFFATATFEHLAGEWQAELIVAGADVVIFEKSVARA